MSADELRARYVGVLLDRLEDTKYPSAPMLDRIEGSIKDRHTAEAYVGTLIDHLSQDRYPSPQLTERVRRLLTYL